MRDELKDRRNIFYMWKGQGVKINHMPLNHPWQIWEIPEVDGEIEDRVKFTKIRKLTKEEQRLIKDKPKGWAKKLKEINERIRNKGGQTD